jgi:hypothetical protein
MLFDGGFVSIDPNTCPIFIFYNPENKIIRPSISKIEQGFGIIKIAEC